MSTIRVLTLGWEFPPLVNGGLGIACLGLSKALAKKVDLRVIVPKADPSVLFDGFQLTGLNNVSYREVEQVDRKYSYDSFALVEHAPIELDPYTTVEGESGVVQFTIQKQGGPLCRGPGPESHPVLQNRGKSRHAAGLRHYPRP